MQGQGEGGGGYGFGEGYGQGGTIGFRFRLRGWAWAWTSQVGDPRNWTGTGDYYDIQVSSYGYGSADDAMAAGRAIGDTDARVVDIYVECDTAGFAGAYYSYNARDQAAKNAPAAEKAAAYEAWRDQGTLDLGGGGDGGAPGKIPWGPLVLLVIVVGAGILFINWLTKGKAEVP